MNLTIDADRNIIGGRNTIGSDEENCSETLSFTITDSSLWGYSAYLEFMTEDGKTYTTDAMAVSQTAGTFSYALPNGLMQAGCLTVQAVLRNSDGTYVYKSAQRLFVVKGSVNAGDAVALKYPDFIGSAEQVLEDATKASEKANQASSAMKSLESSVESAEQVRAETESQRQSAEISRDTAESARKADETARKNAETSRVSAENVRKQNEQDRETSEQSRVTAENNRVSAEDSRVAAEQGRDTAEQARDSAETARKAQFDIWTDDITGMATKAELATETSERKTADNALKYRVKNLESANEGKTLTINTDSTAAYVKNNPDNCLDYGIVSKIYGRDRVCANLINYDDNTFNRSAETDNVFLRVWVYHYEKVLVNIATETSAIISDSFTLDSPTNLTIQVGFSGIGNYEKYITLPAGTYSISVLFTINGLSIRQSELMLNLGSVALPYEPYFDGFYNNTPSKVIVRGTNLLNTFDRSNIPSDSSLYSATLNPDGSYTSTATIDGRTWSYSKSDFKLELEPGTYTLSAIITSSNPVDGIYLFDSNNNNLSMVFTLAQKTSVGIMIKVHTGSAYIMLNRGSVALKYAPYSESSIDISSLGKTLHGIDLSDSSKCDELDLVNRTYTKRVGSRAYQEGDDEDASVITDGTNTYYILDTPIVSTIPITDDFKFFPSTSLGSLTFENDKKDDVLSEVATEVKVA